MDGLDSRSRRASFSRNRSSSRFILQPRLGLRQARRFRHLAPAGRGLDYEANAGSIIPTLHKLHNNWPKIAKILTARLHAPCIVESQLIRQLGGIRLALDRRQHGSQAVRPPSADADVTTAAEAAFHAKGSTNILPPPPPPRIFSPQSPNPFDLVSTYRPLSDTESTSSTYKVRAGRLLWVRPPGSAKRKPRLSPNSNRAVRRHPHRASPHLFETHLNPRELTPQIRREDS